MSRKVLIVDDEEKVRELVRETLEDEDYDLYEAQNGEDALNKAREVKPDLVILDLMMPDLWGYSVCEELKKNPATSGIQVLILTARGSPLSKRMGDLKGGDDYIVKPFEPAELRKKVKKLLGLE
jgi:DNA-binding response OmpR family regulator